MWSRLGLRVGHSEAGIDVAAMLPKTWAASVVVSSQDLSAPDPALSFGVEWAGPGCAHYEMKLCMPLHCMAGAALPEPHPSPPGCLCTARF